MRSELLVEEILYRQCPSSRDRILRIKRGVRVALFEHFDDAGRIADGLFPEHEHRKCRAAREPLCDDRVAAGNLGASNVGNALVVERPTHLLVVVRDLQMPENGDAFRNRVRIRAADASPLLSNFLHGHHLCLLGAALSKGSGEVRSPSPRGPPVYAPAGTLRPPQSIT